MLRGRRGLGERAVGDPVGERILHPAVPQGLRSTHPHRGIHGEQVLDEPLSLGGELPEVLRHHGEPVPTPAHHLAREHGVDGGAQGPHVRLARVAASGDLRRHVALGAAVARHGHLALPPLAAQAEVDELHLVPGVALVHDVLRLDVAVHVAPVVHVLQSLQHLLDHEPRLLIAEPRLLHDVLHHVAALEVLHDQVAVVLAEEDVQHLPDVRVVEGGLDLHLPAHVHLPLHGELPPDEGLEGDPLAGHLVDGHPDHAALALAEGVGGHAVPLLHRACQSLADARPRTVALRLAGGLGGRLLPLLPLSLQGHLDGSLHTRKMGNETLVVRHDSAF
mmetsp:Transcript_29517/g.87593  ORF Transcript_29517/g.87593 Transcript_29517/m.87593 type:complete len:334 (+) Transcript_29517:500-1501(+)